METMKALNELNLEWLRVFHRVASKGGMTAAAKSLFITQPAVSHAVSQLEDRLGMRLFERKARRLVLTAEGEVLYGVTRRMFAVLREGTRELHEAVEMKQTVLRIGCPFLLLRSFLSGYLSDFHRTHASVRIQLEIENRMQPMLDLLRGDKVDLLFLATPKPDRIDPEFLEEQVGAFRYGFVASRAHFGAIEGRRLTLSQINSHPIVILRPGNNTRDWMERVFAKEGLALNVQVETKTMAETEEFVKAGFGLGAMMIDEPEQAGARPEEFFEVKTAKALPAGRYAALYRGQTAQMPAARDFLDCVRRGRTGEMD
jgi:DNA-binding transcriptional LysR family regulator